MQDTHLLTSASATERNQLWNHYKGPIDQDAIKLEFFRKVHRKNPPFRIKVKLGPKNKVAVPLMVKQHYKKPVELLPSLRSVLRLETLNHRNITNKIKDTVAKIECDVETGNHNEFTVQDNLSNDGFQIHNKKIDEHKNGILVLSCSPETYLHDSKKQELKVTCDIDSSTINGDGDDSHVNVKINNKCGRSVDTCDILTNNRNHIDYNKDCIKVSDVNNLPAVQSCISNIEEQNCVYNGTYKCEIKVENCCNDMTDLSLDGKFNSYTLISKIKYSSLNNLIVVVIKHVYQNRNLILQGTIHDELSTNALSFVYYFFFCKLFLFYCFQANVI